MNKIKITEIWKDIVDFIGFYQVSNLGRVKSLERKVQNKNHGSRKIKERILKPNKNHMGYLIGSLSKNGSKKIKIHRLVAEAFIPNPENKPQVNHKNGIKTDNRSDNLEWCTSSENHNHAYEIGLKCAKGDKNGKSKLTTDQVRKIKYDYKEMKQKEIAKIYKIDQRTVSQIRTGARWSHI